MTFCVFAFASDGWVMAADRAELRQTGEAVTIRTQEIGMKICFDDTASVAACFSGDAPARSIAEDIVEAIRSRTFEPDKYHAKGELQEAIGKITNRTLNRENKRWGKRVNGRWVRTVLAVLPSGEVWRIEGTRSVRATLQEHRYGAMYIGDDPNPAIYLLKRYYPSFAFEGRPVSELVYLVSHSVLEANFFNSNAVKGLDMLTYRKKGEEEPGEFHLFDKDELADIEARSIRLASEIGNSLFR